MGRTSIGVWRGPKDELVTSTAGIRELLHEIRSPLFFVDHGAGRVAVSKSGTALLGQQEQSDGLPLLAHEQAIGPENLGDPSFLRDHSLSYPLLGGAMYHGITSKQMVQAFARAGMLAFFGAGGLPLAQIEDAVMELKESLGDGVFGVNLLHSPFEPELEEKTVDLLLERDLRIASASAYTSPSLALLRYRLKGLSTSPDGRVVARQKIFAKVSREEVARRFFSPPPPDMVAELLRRGSISEQEAQLASKIPVAQDITAEADSGGHTDNQPFITMLPTMLALCKAQQELHSFASPLRVGVGGGISTPSAVCAAFSMGAAYVMTGSINQSCQEAGTSDRVKEMLCQVSQGDVTMAPAADMFEMGVKVQVLKRATMFPMRATKLWELYRNHSSLDEIPGVERQKLEKTVFKKSIDEVWRQTEDFFRKRDPRQLEKAQRDEKQKMALVFRWYLGQSSHWATSGLESRRVDYQIQCGPSMGAFNEWCRSTFLQGPEQRQVSLLSLNLLTAASILTRLRSLSLKGIELAEEVSSIAPMRADELMKRLDKSIDGLQ